MRAIVLALFVVASVSCSDTHFYELTISGVELDVEVADTPDLRARGLMYRESLGEFEGMLFVFEESAPRAFYMRNTGIPLSIAYIDERLIIREIYDMEPYSLENVVSRSSAMYALEVNQGAFSAWNVTVGDRLVLSNELADRVHGKTR